MSNVISNASTLVKQTEYTVNRKELPLCCPTKTMPLWSAHPRVYLPLGEVHDGKEKHEVVCPYCDTKFVLMD